MDLKGNVFAILICIASASKHFQVPEWENLAIGNIIMSFP